MANIVITHFSGICYGGRYHSSCFYDGLTKAFIEAGHDILHVITSNFLVNPWNGNNKAISEEVGDEVRQKIRAFNPDLIISFNNSSISGIEDIVSCPILLWDADSLRFFNDKENIKRKIDRYLFSSFSNAGLEDYRVSLDLKSSQVCYIPSATEVTSKKEPKSYNISFIGTPFFSSSNTIDFLIQYPQYLNYSHADFLNDKENLEDALKKAGVSFSELCFHKSGDRRVKLITALMDLDIKVFGPEEWLGLAPYVTEIIKRYEPRVIHSLHHNELVYNRSKIALSVCHSQNITGYPWRVADIMASDSVLLSDSTPDLFEHFGKAVDLQTYSSPMEAYSLASKLLSDEQWRQDLILQQNAVVEDNFRWKHRFPIIQQLTGVNLEANTKCQGKYKKLEITTPLIKPRALEELLCRGTRKYYKYTNTYLVKKYNRASGFLLLSRLLRKIKIIEKLSKKIAFIITMKSRSLKKSSVYE